MESIWSQTCEIKAREPLTGDRETEIAVIGGGMAGILTAAALHAAGRRVVVLEAKPDRQRPDPEHHGEDHFAAHADLPQSHRRLWQRKGAAIRAGKRGGDPGIQADHHFSKHRMRF